MKKDYSANLNIFVTNLISSSSEKDSKIKKDYFTDLNIMKQSITQTSSFLWKKHKLNLDHLQTELNSLSISRKNSQLQKEKKILNISQRVTRENKQLDEQLNELIDSSVLKMKNQKHASKRSKRKRKTDSEHCKKSQNKNEKISNIKNQALISENDANKKQKNKFKFKATSLHKIVKLKNLLFKQDLFNLSKISILMNILDADNISFVTLLIIKTFFHSILKKNKKSFKKHSQKKNEISEMSARKRKCCNVFIKILKKQWSQIMKKDWSIQFK